VCEREGEKERKRNSDRACSIVEQEDGGKARVYHGAGKRWSGKLLLWKWW